MENGTRCILLEGWLLKSDSQPNGVRPPNLLVTEEGLASLFSGNQTPLLENKSMKRARGRLEYYGSRLL